MRIRVYLFAFLMISLFAIFIAAVPVRTLTPQVARLRYYALQDNLEGGTLSSSLRNFDWRKSFAWRASDTEYRQRQFTQFFEMLTPRLYAHLYYAFGPFMWLPLSLLCALAIGFLIALVVRQWTGSWLPGLVAGSFWLMTTEVLVGHHAPVRYAKDFAALQILGLLSVLLYARKPGRRWTALAVFIVLAAAGLFTDEYILFAFPAFVLLFFICPWLRRLRWPALAALVVLTLATTWLFINVLPYYFYPVFQQPYMRVRAASWSAPGEILLRNVGYLWLNTLDIFAYTFGYPPPRLPLRAVLAAAAAVLLLYGLIRARAWKGNGRLIVFWVALAVPVGGLLLPEGTNILHQHTYYNRPLVAVLMIPLGLFTARIIDAGKKGLLWLWLGALTLCALLNFNTLAPAIQNDPEEAYLTRYGLNEILQLYSRLQSGELEPPVLLSYPQHYNVVNGVYSELEFVDRYTLDDGFPWSLYRALVPRLYLLHFEKGELRADPRQFTVWQNYDEHRYRYAANYFYDMPGGVVWDLEVLRSAVLSFPESLTWRKEEDVGSRTGDPVKDLLGEAPFVSLDRGEWRASIPVSGGEYSRALIFAIRHQGDCFYEVREAYDRSQAAGELSYRWSFQLFSLRLEKGSEGAEMIIRVGERAEVIGPILVPAKVIEPVPSSRRGRAPRAGVPLLELRGRAR